MNIRLVVFDLDGTIVSSHETIYEATIESLNRVGINNRLERGRFFNMIGMHFEDIFREFGFAVPDFNHFIKIYKSIYFNYINSSLLYPGVIETLAALKKSGINTALLTTKAQDQADLILKHFELHHYFDYVMGRRTGIAHKPSPEPLLKICSSLGIAPNETLMVGDSELDVECGKNAGTHTCAVTYGYRAPELLKSAAPDFLIDIIGQIEYIVNNKK